MYGHRQSTLGLLLAVASTLALGCGQSDRVGWGDQENGEPEAGGAMPEGEAPQGAAPEGEGPQALMQEYQQRAQSLEDLRVQAMQDDELQGVWESLSSDVDERMVERNPELQTLMGRAEEIEDRVNEVQSAGDTLSAQEQQMLAMQYQNIQNTLGQARSEVFQEEEFSDRLESFQDALYQEMRELAPDRSEEVDTLQRLGDRIVVMLDSLRQAEAEAGDTAAGLDGPQ